MINPTDYWGQEHRLSTAAAFKTRPSNLRPRPFEHRRLLLPLRSQRLLCKGLERTVVRFKSRFCSTALAGVLLVSSARLASDCLPLWYFALLTTLAGVTAISSARNPGRCVQMAEPKLQERLTKQGPGIFSFYEGRSLCLKTKTERWIPQPQEEGSDSCCSSDKRYT